QVSSILVRVRRDFAVGRRAHVRHQAALRHARHESRQIFLLLQGELAGRHVAIHGLRSCGIGRAHESFSKRTALYLSSAWREIGSASLVVAALTQPSSRNAWPQWKGMKSVPGLIESSTRKVARAKPRRDTNRTGSPSDNPSTWLSIEWAATKGA